MKNIGDLIGMKSFLERIYLITRLGFTGGISREYKESHPSDFLIWKRVLTIYLILLVTVLIALLYFFEKYVWFPPVHPPS